MGKINFHQQLYLLTPSVMAAPLKASFHSRSLPLFLAAALPPALQIVLAQLPAFSWAPSSRAYIAPPSLISFSMSPPAADSPTLQLIDFFDIASEFSKHVNVVIERIGLS